MTDAQLVDQSNSLVDNTNTSLGVAKSPDQVANTNLKDLTEEERLKLRLKKFGAQSENIKKDVRAQRFGAATSDGSAQSSPDPSVLAKRAQRFGVATAPSTPTGGADKELLEKRAQRFGVAAANDSNGSSKPTDEVLAKRKERFGETASSDDDSKKKLRQQRFQTKV